MNEYYEKNKEKINARNKKYQEDNKEELKKKRKMRYELNKNKINSERKKHYETNKKEILHKVKIRYNRNKNVIDFRNKEYRRNNIEKVKAYKKSYREENKKEISRKGMEKRRELKKFVANMYGSKCSCCGENQIEFLSFDHKDGGGNEHRRKVGSGSTFLYWLIKNNFPKSIRILCHNCNQSLGCYGYCPHKPEIVNKNNILRFENKNE